MPLVPDAVRRHVRVLPEVRAHARHGAPVPGTARARVRRARRARAARPRGLRTLLNVPGLRARRMRAHDGSCPRALPEGRGSHMGDSCSRCRTRKDGMQGVMKEGAASRVTTSRRWPRGMGGSIASFDFAFGNTDVYVIAEMPDEVTAAAVATAVGGVGRGEHRDRRAALGRGHRRRDRQARALPAARRDADRGCQRRVAS